MHRHALLLHTRQGGLHLQHRQVRCHRGSVHRVPQCRRRDRYLRPLQPRSWRPTQPTSAPSIMRSGTPGNYTYSVAPDWANRPVNYVSWGDSARFVNWLTTASRPAHQTYRQLRMERITSTAQTASSALMAVTRKPGVRWWIPSVDEWYKAAYYDPNKPGGAGYWDYPTRSTTPPSNVLDPRPVRTTPTLKSQGHPRTTSTRLAIHIGVRRSARLPVPRSLMAPSTREEMSGSGTSPVLTVIAVRLARRSIKADPACGRPKQRQLRPNARDHTT